MKKDVACIIHEIKKHGNEKNRQGMKRFGINVQKAFGVSINVLRDIAHDIGKDHLLAVELWGTGFHEARLLAGLIDDATLVTVPQMESWVKDFDSWDVCDMCCGNLFDKTKYAYVKAIEWTTRKEEFVKRAGFVLMATLAVHDKKASDSEFITFFPMLIRESTDERNFVKKAVNWALRQIGKRNMNLNKKAILLSEEIHLSDSKAARWIAADALRELKSSNVLNRLKTKDILH